MTTIISIAVIITSRVLFAIIESRSSRETTTSKTPRMRTFGEWAWQSAFEQSGSFWIGLINPRTRLVLKFL